MPVYTEAHRKYTWLAESITLYQGGNHQTMPFDRIVYLFQAYFLTYISGLTELHTQLPTMDTVVGSDDFERQFDLYFAAGPGGLDFLLGATQTLYAFMCTIPDREKHEDILRRQTRLQEFCSVLVKSLKHLRLKIPRERWDPKAFRKFEREYRLAVSAGVLPVSHFSCIVICGVPDLPSGR